MSYDSDNIFAKIIRGDIPCDKVYEDESVLAFNDISPAAPTHILVIPKSSYMSFDDFARQAGAEEVSNFFTTVQTIADKAGLSGSGYRLITNHGSDASQSVPHFHVHILGGKPLGGLIPGDESAR
ncbi:MAG: histidine triad nucleotide-binding protein [Rickettsiales bacterium]|nr:histidine triad nucleotide-binding protein [Rickettsiales bacterium]|tara:strand:+ start:175 stop:549 length:375 start_codon:yes stop_codon:yes gene_type:complete